MRKIIVFFSYFLLFGNNLLFCQAPTIAFSKGFYAGGDLREGSRTCGYYWFSNDSLFFMIALKNDSTIQSIGTGKWWVGKDLSLTRNFEKTPDLYLYPNKIQYTVESKGSRDSIYYIGTVKNEMGEPVQFTSVTFPGIKTFVTDSSGKFHIQLSSDKAPEEIKFGRIQYAPFKLKLMANYNYHTINISLIRDYSMGDNYSEMSFAVVDPQIKVCKLKKDRNIYFGCADVKFEKLSDSKEKFIHIMSVAKLKQPNLIPQLNWLEKKLKGS